MKPLREYLTKRERRRLGRYIRRGVLPKASSEDDKGWLYLNYISQKPSAWRKWRLFKLTGLYYCGHCQGFTDHNTRNCMLPVFMG